MSEIEERINMEKAISLDNKKFAVINISLRNIQQEKRNRIEKMTGDFLNAVSEIILEN